MTYREQLQAQEHAQQEKPAKVMEADTASGDNAATEGNVLCKHEDMEN